MREFFSTLMRWLELIRRVFINGIFLVFLLVLLIAMFSAAPEVPDNAVLVLNPKGDLVDQIATPETDGIPLAIPESDQVLVPKLVSVLKAARDDSKIRMLRLELGELRSAPLSKLQELRRAIEFFKQSGKPVIVSGTIYSQAQYYLAATADKVFLNPMGIVELSGFAVYRNYFREALDKLDINAQVFRAGNYKSALEPVMRNNMSEDARLANSAWLQVLWDAYKRDISEMRKIKPERIQQVLDQPTKFLAKHGGNIASLAKAEGLVDELADAIEVEDYIAEQMGDDYETVTYKSYDRLTPGKAGNGSDQLVAVITASGVIVSGEKPAGTVGDITISKLLRDAREDEDIKAVVLRIDSPGGSAMASEVIRREILRVREAGKPVVVSMGSLAASGGYWIAAAADEIWAAPTTLTGSIGVFGLFADIHKGLGKLGIHTDGVGTTAIAGRLRSDMPMSNELAKAFQMGVDDTYRKFIDIVAKGRNMNPEKVKALAGGRVWSGEDALKNGLVDQHGDLKDAIAAAAKRAGISDDYDEIRLEPNLNPLEMLLGDMLGEARVWLAGAGSSAMLHFPGSRALQEIGFELQRLAQFNDPRNIYAYCEVVNN